TAEPSGQQEALLLALAHLYTHGIDPHWPIPDTSTPVPLPLRSWNHDHVDPSTATIVRLQDLDIERIEQVIEDQVIRTVRELTARTGSELTPSTPFTDLGLESLARAHLHTQLLTRMPDLAGL